MPKKEYTKTGRSCRVTFDLPAEVNAQTACLCGEFNDWDQSSHPMKRAKDGSFSLTISIKPGRQYRYRYLLDGERWENDWAADSYAPNALGSEDSVVNIEKI
jgi:1,4-alpha-glucan branching enzyme